MKRFIVAMLIVIAFILPVNTFAQKQPKRVVLEKSETVDTLYFAAGDSVRLMGTINNDAYVAGGTVDVDGTVNGDLMIAGGTVSIRGSVLEDMRVAGGTVTISGVVNGNVTVAGGTVTIDDDAQIDGSVIAGAGTITMLGPVGQEAVIGAGTAVLNGPVGADVRAGAGELTVGPDSRIAGNLTYHSENPAVIEQGAVVSGETVFKKVSPPQMPSKEQQRNTAQAVFFTGKFFSLVILFLIGFIFSRLFPIHTKHIVGTVQKEKLKSIGIGFLIFVAAPILALALILTLIGIPFAVLLMFMYFLLFYTAKVFVALFIGTVIMKRLSTSKSVSLALLVGLIAHLILTVIPFLGWLIGGVITLWGAGAYVTTCRSTYQSLRKKELI